VERARKARERAEQRMAKQQENIDHAPRPGALARAMAPRELPQPRQGCRDLRDVIPPGIDSTPRQAAPSGGLLFFSGRRASGAPAPGKAAPPRAGTKHPARDRRPCTFCAHGHPCQGHGGQGGMATHSLPAH
jgi:hypothetical protein